MQQRFGPPPSNHTLILGNIPDIYNFLQHLYHIIDINFFFYLFTGAKKGSQKKVTT